MSALEDKYIKEVGALSHQTKEPLEKNLIILEAMLAELDAYLKHDGLSYPLATMNYPRLTLCGYLLREQRLLAVASEVDNTEWLARLSVATTRFRDIAAANLVNIETRLHLEIAARLRQWREYLRDIEYNSDEYAVYYGTAVVTRAMIAAAVEYLHLPPYKLDNTLPDKLARLDDQLREMWGEGDFVWASIWQAAYPSEVYWWLYGQPKALNRL